MTTAAAPRARRRRVAPAKAPTRARMLEATADLLQKQGYAGTGLAEILEASGAPRGSLYFHFPGGKEQLASEALAANGREWLQRFEAIGGTTRDPGEAIDAACAMLAEELETSAWQLGCPIATVALEAAHASEPIRATCAAHFAALEDLVVKMLEGHGVPHEIAVVAATLGVSAIEGALLLARVQRSRAPLDRVAFALRAQISALVPPRT